MNNNIDKEYYIVKSILYHVYFNKKILENELKNKVSKKMQGESFGLIQETIKRLIIGKIIKKTWRNYIKINQVYREEIILILKEKISHLDIIENIEEK